MKAPTPGTRARASQRSGSAAFAASQSSVGDLRLSTLMLGTVQLGMSYGIANKTGQPSYRQARDILACAFAGGVNGLDTAATYGHSERVLGRALAELGMADKVVIATKIRHPAEPWQSQRAARSAIEESVARSLRALRLEALPICLFHMEDDFRYVEHLLRLKRKGLVRHVGASVTTPGAASAIVRSGLAEAIQAPTNLLDHRFTRRSVLADARRRGVPVFIRSAYLQGLLLMPERGIPARLRMVVPHRRRLSRLAREAGMSLKEFALRYVLGLDGMTCAVVGVETVAQVRQNLALFAKGPLAPDLARAVAEIVPDLPDRILMPNKWFEEEAQAGRGTT